MPLTSRPWTSRFPCEGVPETARQYEALDLGWHKAKQIMAFRGDTDTNWFVDPSQLLEGLTPTRDLGAECSSSSWFSYKLRRTLSLQALCCVGV